MTSTELLWTSSGTLFDLEWGLQGFTQGTGTMVTDLTSTSYELTDLAIDVNYEFYVRQDCGEDGESIWAGPYSFSVGYCKAGALTAEDESISNITFADINNSSFSTVGYENFTSISTDVTQGNTYTFSVTISDYYDSDEVIVWIDYNQDGDFDDIGELVLTLPLTSISGTGNITIPSDAAIGTTRMRVRLHYSDEEGNTTPCGNSFYGQVEDYTINITDPCSIGTIVPSFSQVADICEGTLLEELPTTSLNGITGTWSPALDNTQTTTYTFTPDPGQCATTTTMTITVIPNVVPEFDPISDICEGTLLEELPTTSLNGITGTWSPALDNTQTTTYTFTPAPGQCATTTTLPVTLTLTIVPKFAPIADICEGTLLEELPTTSLNGITGTWSPALDDTQTTTYTFTPDPGQCATTTTMPITVIPNVVPEFDPISDICEGTLLEELPTTSINGITGTWSPALDDTQTTTSTFTHTSEHYST